MKQHQDLVLADFVHSVFNDLTGSVWYFGIFNGKFKPLV